MAAIRGALILLLCFASVGLAQTVSTGKTVRRHHQEDFASAAVFRAEAAMDKKDYAAAESVLKEAIQHDPESYRAWYDLGLVYNDTNRRSDAIEAYRKSVTAFPKLFESNFNLAVLLARAGDPEAERFLLAATETAPTENRDLKLAAAWRTLGQWIQDKDPKRALAAFQKAAALQPKEAVNHLSAAMVAEKLGDLATAEQEYKAAEASPDRDPKSNAAIAGLVNVYTKTKRLPEAEAALRKVLAVDSDSVDAHVLLGRVLAHDNRNEEALEQFETALRLDPRRTETKRDLAMVYAEAGQYAKAEPFFREAVQAQPNDAELRHRLGKVLLEQKKFADAQQELLAAVNLKQDYGVAYGDLALAASANKDYALTIKALDARARTLPELPATFFLRATAYDHLRDYEQAAANYHQFLLVADGRFPDQEWQARHRLVAIEPKKK